MKTAEPTSQVRRRRSPAFSGPASSAQAQSPCGGPVGLSARALSRAPARSPGPAPAETRGPGALGGCRRAAGWRGAGRRDPRHAGNGAVRPALGHRQRRLGLPGGLRAVPASAVVRSGCGARPGRRREGAEQPRAVSVSPDCGPEPALLSRRWSSPLSEERGAIPLPIHRWHSEAQSGWAVRGVTRVDPPPVCPRCRAPHAHPPAPACGPGIALELGAAACFTPAWCVDPHSLLYLPNARLAVTPFVRFLSQLQLIVAEFHDGHTDLAFYIVVFQSVESVRSRIRCPKSVPRGSEQRVIMFNY